MNEFVPVLRLRSLSLMLVLLSSILLSACASNNDQPGIARAESFKMSIAYYNENGDSLGHMMNGEQILLLFPSIKGQIFGIPRRPILTEVTVSDNQPFIVELPSINSTDSAVLADTKLTTGLLIQPAQTQMLRVATMAFEKETRQPFAAGSLIDAATGDNLLLMYFSEPCYITGSVESAGLRYDHEIKIKKAGWHWIAGTQPSAGVSKLRALRAQPDKVEFAITVDGMLAL